MHKRGLTSFLTLGGFLIATVSGIILYIAPTGWAANRTNWTVLGLDKHEWTDVHIVFSILWLVAVGFHLFYNWRVLQAFIYNKAKGGMRLKKELGLALAIMTVVFFMGVYRVPPVGYISLLSEEIKTNYAVRINQGGGGWSGAAVDSAPREERPKQSFDRPNGGGRKVNNPYGAGSAAFNPNAWGHGAKDER